MKRITLLTVCLLLLTTAAWSDTLFSNYSASNGSAQLSLPINVSGAKVKTVQVTGISVANHLPVALSGTFVLYCGPDSLGPWITCKDRGNVLTTTTTSAIFTIDDSTQWMQASWTKTSGELSAWLLSR